MKRKQLWILGGGLAVVLVGGVAIAGPGMVDIDDGT